MRDGWLAHATVTRPSPKAGKAPGPLIVLFHGGGFMAGVPESMTPYARGLVRLFDAVVVCPSYRLAPEDPFPAAPHDVWESLKWAAHNAGGLKSNPRRGFIVGGASTGGNFSPMLARKAVDECLEPPLTGHWVGVPVQARPYTVPLKYRHLWTSWSQNADAPLINATEAEILFDYYRPDYRSPLFNPLATSFDIRDMPPAFVMVAGMDLIRDDGIVYSYTLDDAHVPVMLKAYAGVPHSFWAYFPTLPQSKKAMVDIAKGFSWMLKIGISDKQASDAMLKNY